MTKEFNSLLAAQLDPFNLAWDLSFVNVWSIVGEGIGIPSFSLKTIYLLLTGIHLLSLIFIFFQVQKSSFFLNEITLLSRYQE